MKDRIAVLAWWKDYDRKKYLRAAQVADELGYDSFWVPEAWGYEVFALLAEMAGVTKRIKLGTGIVNAFSRTPGLLAMSAATLDEISEGRFILGLGTSGVRVIQGFHGREFGKPLSQVRDVIKVVRALVAGQKLTDAGATLHEYRPFELAMKPLKPKIPIYVAALKQKSIESIGELADGWIPAFWPYDKLDVGRQWIADGAKRAGRDPSEITTAPFTTVLPLGREAGVRRSKETISFYIGGMGDYYKEILIQFGWRDVVEKVDATYRNHATRAQAPDAVPDELVESLSISGDPDFCREELRRRRAFGQELPILSMPIGTPVEMIELFLHALAPQS